MLSALYRQVGRACYELPGLTGRYKDPANTYLPQATVAGPFPDWNDTRTFASD